MHGSETWTLTKEDIKWLEAFEMWVWRRILKISWTEHKTNEEVLNMVKEERKLMETIRKGKRTGLDTYYAEAHS